MKKSTYTTIAFIVLLLAGGLYYFVKDEPLTPKPPQPAAQSSPASRVSFAGSSIVEEKDGKRQWELSAENIEVDQNTKEVFLKNLKGVFYRDNGGRIDITADAGTMDPGSKDILMTGNVKAVADDGAVLYAGETKWVAKDRHILGSGGIKMTREDTVITGDRFDSDANMDKVKVQGNAHVIKGGQPQ